DRARPVVGLKRILKTLQSIERIAAVAVGSRVPWPQRNHPVEAVERLCETVEVVETRPKIPDGRDGGRIDRERLLNQFDAARGTTGLQRNDAGQMQRIKVVRLGFENLFVRGLSLAEAALLVGGKPLFEFFLNRQMKLPRMRNVHHAGA